MEHAVEIVLFFFGTSFIMKRKQGVTLNATLIVDPYFHRRSCIHFT